MPTNCKDCHGKYRYHLNLKDTDGNGTCEIHRLKCPPLGTSRYLVCLMTNHASTAYDRATDVMEDCYGLTPSFCGICCREEEDTHD